VRRAVPVCLALVGGLLVPTGASAVVKHGSPVSPTRTATRVVGHGTPASCTAKAFRRAVSRGGVITFDCGTDPLTIRLNRTAQVRNDRAPKVVIDGGGLVTLSGNGKLRILYQNTCDPDLGITSSHCQDQATPKLVLRDLTLVRGNSTGRHQEGGGGGAVFVRGGRLKVVNSTFRRNRCDRFGADLGGAAIRVLDQHRDRPVRILRSTFERGRCSNGGALSSIGVSWVVRGSEFRGNRAIGRGANPARPGTPGGGSGGALYADGNTFTVRLFNTLVQGNWAREGGGAIFFVSNDRTGSLHIADSELHDNHSEGFETPGYPGIFFLGKGKPHVSGSTIE
jgi:hypothetical protein